MQGERGILCCLLSTMNTIPNTYVGKINNRTHYLSLTSLRISQIDSINRIFKPVD